MARGDGGAVDLRAERLGAADEGGAELDAGGAEGEGGGDAAAVGDAAGGDHRHGDGVGDLRDQRERADAGVVGLDGEGAAVAAGLPALGDDRVDAGLVERAGLGDRGGGAEDAGAGGAQPRDGVARRAGRSGS